MSRSIDDTRLRTSGSRLIGSIPVAHHRIEAAPGRKLARRQILHRRHLPLRRRVPDVRHHAHNLAPRRTVRAPIARARLQLLPQRVLAVKILLRESLVHDHHLRRLRRVPIAEVPPRQQRKSASCGSSRETQRRPLRSSSSAFRHGMLRILEAQMGIIVRHRRQHRSRQPPARPAAPAAFRNIADKTPAAFSCTANPASRN